MATSLIASMYINTFTHTQERLGPITVDSDETNERLERKKAEFKTV